jgi:peptidyl-prolyl cis-trans isomerase SDCCAG10
MANSGKKDTNDSQFFITLGTFLKSKFRIRARLENDYMLTDRADELHGKHTLFGRCMGDTVYSEPGFIIIRFH